ncbi:MAG: UTP--glucose-1-phosphate uridylyltransferase GalU [Ktedonobacterales bacterium]|nr:UTP--glucose-1-phosphate uridylyltransferase GalU [Ktedonobacterales bacterium]
MPIRKAIIPAAGLGTRMLPATKSVPKEMLPLADRPTIQYIVEEAVASGIQHITMITSRVKRALEDYFDDAPELRAVLERKGDTAALEMLDHTSRMAQFSFTRQHEPRGLGHAVLVARDLMGAEPFGVLLGDDLVDHPERPCLRQLMDVHERHGGCVIAVMRVPREQISRYGIAAIDSYGDLDARTHRVQGLVEKPSPEQAPSNLAVIGRYVLTPSIFDVLEQTPPGRGGEIQLTDALHTLGQSEPVYAYEFEGTRYDTGDPVGLITTSLAYALQRPDLAPGIRAYLRTLRLD